MQKFIVFFLIAVLIFPLAVSARIGVGVATGKIQVNQALKPGGNL